MRLTTSVLAALTFSLVATCEAAAPPSSQKTFDSPKEAVAALLQASEKNDVAALLAILGPDGKALVSSGDAVQDRSERAKFVAAAGEKTEVAPDPKDAHRATLVVGNKGWPFPVPVVQTNGRWRFESKEGAQELLARRIGENELDAIEICRGYVEAQKEYASEDRDGSGVHQYARRFVSTPGTHDGLCWKNPDGTPGGPIAELAARALAEGYTGTAEPYHGYRFKILTKQGPAARLGSLDYVVNGTLIGGFALIAWPAEYRVTGVMTFLVNHEGIVYEKDLGTDTPKNASQTTTYDPDNSWTPAEDAP
ncbi:MAG: DUF2950 domain-containing protein [Thermoanaerobaculia bacterium]